MNLYFQLEPAMAASLHTLMSAASCESTARFQIEAPLTKNRPNLSGTLGILESEPRIQSLIL